MQEGKIEIKLDGANFQETERCRKIIHELFTQGFFSIKNGKAIIHFNEKAEMAMIQYDFIKWKKTNIQSETIYKSGNTGVWRDEKKSTPIDLPKDLTLGNIESTLITE
jgi:uncharacterized beta-barrel protein YwiB (DUF1934 family)